MFSIIGQIAATFAIFQQSRIQPMEQETTVERYSRYLQAMNKGGMRSFQSDPNDLETQCMETTAKTNALLDKMFKGQYYKDGEITQAEFTEKF